MTLITIDTAKIGKKGGEARAANLSPKARSASASEAARARWDTYYREHPEKLKAKKARDARKAADSIRVPKKRP